MSTSNPEATYWTIESGPPVKLVVVERHRFRAAFSLDDPAPQTGRGEKTVVPPVIVPHCRVVE